MARFSSALVAVCLLAVVCAPVASAASSRRSLSQKTASTAHSKSKGKGKGGSGPPGEWGLRVDSDI
jgi:hypothetical protein